MLDSAVMPVRVTYSDFPCDPPAGYGTEIALAVITGTEGPSYRPIGAAMLIGADQSGAQILAGTLSSGCIEQDIALHALDCLHSAQPRSIRYGIGSPYIDIRLPCGGGLDVLIIPRPSTPVLHQIRQNRAARQPTFLRIGPEGVALARPGQDGLHLVLEPDLSFHVFGKGPEAATFAAMAQAAGYQTRLYTPDPETRAAAGPSVKTHALTTGDWPAPAVFDRRSAVVLFFHDHEWEPRILDHASRSAAFYIGAQGSRRTRQRRDEALRARGVSADRIAGMKGPMGLIPRAKDARTLAISVLADIVDQSFSA